MTKQQLASALREARLAQHMTQRQLGDALGFTPSSAAHTVSRWESGVIPEWDRVVAWAAAVGCELIIQAGTPDLRP